MGWLYPRPTTPNLEALGDHKRIRSGWLNGITEWPVDFKCPMGHS